MANQDTSFGLRPIGLTGSGANTTGVTQYEIASDNTNAIFQYSPVIPLAAGVIDIVGNANGGTVPALGVLMGVEYVDSSTKKTVFKNFWPGANSVSVDTNFPVKAFVADKPNQLFMVAADTTCTCRSFYKLFTCNSYVRVNKQRSFNCSTRHFHCCEYRNIVHAYC